MPIFEVTITKETIVWIEAEGEDEARGEACGIACTSFSSYDWDVDSYAYERTPLEFEWIETPSGAVEYGELLKLREWIDAIEKAEAIDPNQGVFNV